MSGRSLISLLFVVYVLLTLIFLLMEKRIKRLRALLVFLIVIFLLSVFGYFYIRDYIVSRVDAKYIIDVSSSVLKGVNPYTSQYPSYYGPMYPILISPIALLPSDLGLVLYGEFLLLLILYSLYRIFLHHGFTRDRALIYSLIISLNPAIHYYGIGLTQIDDLIIGALGILSLLTIILRKHSLSITIMSISTMTKITSSIYSIPMLSGLDRGFTYLLSYILLSAIILFIGYVFYGPEMIYRAYLVHTDRIGGLSIYKIIAQYSDHLITLFALLAVLVPVLSALYMGRVCREKFLYERIIIALTLFYLFSPLNFPEYIMWTLPIAYVYIFSNKNMFLLTLYSIEVLLGRAWQELVQSVNADYSSIDKVLSLLYFVINLFIMAILLLTKIGRCDQQK
ncbi:MAG: glycosyltransferase 87 family protein [Sulfolobales archaeon]